MKNMNKPHLNLGSFTCLIISVFCVYCLLLNNDALPCSINSVEMSLTHWLRHWRILVVGLMPIYISFTLFGAASVSLLLGSVLQNWLIGLFRIRRIE
jgi:hypothetical protein